MIEQTVAARNLGGAGLARARILAVMPSIPLQGMERANLRILSMMRERGADVLFITERTHGERVQRAVEEAGCRWAPATCLMTVEERLHLTARPLEMSGVLRAWSRAARQIAAIHREYRPTHVYVTNLSFFLYALPVVWRTRAQVVFRLPNPPDTRRLGMKGHLVRAIWTRLVEPACDVIVTNSTYTAGRLEAIGIGSKKVRVIYNPLPDARPARVSDAPRLDRGRFNVVYLGRILPEKGVDELAQAARRIVRERPDVDFYLVGEHRWQNPFAEALIARLHADGLDERIRVLHEIEDVFGLLAQCDLHVCPSVSAGESLPNVVLEAKSEGVPSVVFPTAGLPEVVTHLVDGYVCPEKTAAALHDGIRYYLQHGEALQAAGLAALRSAERFARDRVAEDWSQVFDAA